MKKLIVFLTILSLSACTKNNENQGVDRMAMIPPSAKKVNDPHAEMVNGTSVKKLIKEGQVTFETTDLEKTKSRITASVAANNAYVSSDQESKSPNKISYALTVRVPAIKFDSFLSAATQDVSSFDQKEIHVKDVTAEYLDNETRLKTKRDIEARYSQLLGKASTVTDILNIEKELGAIRTEIESAEGQLKLLTDQVQYSTLQITFYKTISTHEAFSNRIRTAFVGGWENLLALFVLLVDLWPFVILALMISFGFRRLKRRKADIKDIPSEQIFKD